MRLTPDAVLGEAELDTDAIAQLRAEVSLTRRAYASDWGEVDAWCGRRAAITLPAASSDGGRLSRLCGDVEIAGPGADAAHQRNRRRAGLTTTAIIAVRSGRVITPRSEFQRRSQDCRGYGRQWLTGLHRLRNRLPDRCCGQRSKRRPASCRRAGRRRRGGDASWCCYRTLLGWSEKPHSRADVSLVLATFP
jgi:hypothetical protein